MSNPLTCSICTEDLTIKNVVNTECKHPTCKTCFWRWAKDKNTCPFCREHLLKNDEEAKDIQRMRELLNLKSNIIRQVEKAYEEEEDLLDSINKKTQEVYEMNNAIDLAKNRLKVLEKSQGGRYKTYKYLKIVMQETKRRNRRGIQDQELFSNYKKVVNDIKGLSQQCPATKFYGNHLSSCGSLGQWLLNHVRCMEQKRKERRKIKAYNDNIDEESPALDILFSQEEEFDMPNVPYIANSDSDMDIDDDLSDIPSLEEEVDFDITSLELIQGAIIQNIIETESPAPILTPPREPHRENLNAPPSVIRNNLSQAASGRASRRLFPPYTINDTTRMYTRMGGVPIVETINNPIPER